MWPPAGSRQSRLDFQQVHESPGAATGAQPRCLPKTCGHSFSNQTSPRPWWSPFRVKKVGKGVTWGPSTLGQDLVSSSGHLSIPFASILESLQYVSSCQSPPRCLHTFCGPHSLRIARTLSWHSRLSASSGLPFILRVPAPSQTPQPSTLPDSTLWNLI